MCVDGVTFGSLVLSKMAQGASLTLELWLWPWISAGEGPLGPVKDSLRIGGPRGILAVSEK